MRSLLVVPFVSLLLLSCTSIGEEKQNMANDCKKAEGLMTKDLSDNMSPEFSRYIGYHSDVVPLDVYSDYESVRVLGPLSIATMDYNPFRLNVFTDCSGRITGFRPG